MNFHRDLTGSDLHAPSNQIVENNTGSTVTALKCVTYEGIGTNFPSIVIANGGADRVRGVVQADIVDGAPGYVTSLGFMYGYLGAPLDTSAWPVNTALYADASGNLSIVPYGALVATVYKQDAVDGVIYVENSYNGGGGGGGITGPFSSTDNAIVRWDGVTGNLVADSKTVVQDSGAIEAQGFITRRDVVGTVTVHADETWISPDLDLMPGSEVVLEPGSELIII